MTKILRSIALGLLGLSLPGSALAAPVETVLHSFINLNDGAYPIGGLIADNKGNFYGTTFSGGGGGTVFELLPPATFGSSWTVTVLAYLSGNPFAGVIADSKGNLYGTTKWGGSFGWGSVFELSPPAVAGGTWTETVLWNFSGGSDGGYPITGLIADSKGNLYGSTTTSGALVCQHGGDCILGSHYVLGAGPSVYFELSPPPAPGVAGPRPC